MNVSRIDRALFERMANDPGNNDDNETTIPHAKRDGREGTNPESLPGEYADDFHTNRFSSPPPPAPAEKDD